MLCNVFVILSKKSEHLLFEKILAKKFMSGVTNIGVLPVLYWKLKILPIWQKCYFTTVRAMNVFARLTDLVRIPSFYPKTKAFISRDHTKASKCPGTTDVCEWSGSVCGLAIISGVWLLLLRHRGPASVADCRRGRQRTTASQYRATIGTMQRRRPCSRRGDCSRLRTRPRPLARNT